MALQVLYVKADEGIAVYHRSPGGGLTLHTASAAPGGTFCVTPNRSFMFVAGDGHFHTHPIDPQTGGLGDAVAGAAFTDGPAYMATDRSGRFLLHASYGACRARICLWSSSYCRSESCETLQFIGGKAQRPFISSYAFLCYENRIQIRARLPHPCRTHALRPRHKPFGRRPLLRGPRHRQRRPGRAGRRSSARAFPTTRTPSSPTRPTALSTCPASRSKAKSYAPPAAAAGPPPPRAPPRRRGHLTNRRLVSSQRPFGAGSSQGTGNAIHGFLFDAGTH